MRRARVLGVLPKGFGIVVVVLALVASGCGDDADDATTTTQGSDPLLVATQGGELQGAESAVDGVRQFLDIPYAEPPTGENAWRPPQPVTPSDEPIDATEPGLSCPQTALPGDEPAFLVTPDADPDCLRLNVWAPDDADGLPVMVWIHGGSLTSGSAAQPYYIGDDLAAEGVLVVSMNYRLGAQGFLATEELASESEDGAVGNYGLLDQQAALEWVQANIAGFGGNPDDVTIFGQSAGGFSVCGHLASPASDGLFAKAIIQSAGIPGFDGCGAFQTTQGALRAGERFMNDVGCDDVACLRALPEDDLVAVEDFNPVLVADGVVLSESAQERAQRGELDDTPVLIGSNADEGTLFTLQEDEPTEAGLVELAAAFTDDPEALVALYPPSQFDSNLARYQAMLTDVRFTCPTLDFASVAPESYVYHYTYVDEQDTLGLGATHGAELAVLFNHPEGISAVEVEGTDEGLELSDLIQGAWTTFATDGDPGEGFDLYADGGKVTIIDMPFEQVDEIRDGRCEEVTALTSGAR